MWTIEGVWINTKVEIADALPRRYDPKGVEVAHGEPHGRQCLGSSNPYVDGEWNRAEALVLGADSVEHRVNGIVTFQGWKLRVGGENNFENPLNNGTIGLQSEAADIFYRNFKVQPLDKTGKPLYAKTVVSILPPYRRSLSEKGKAAVHGLGSPVISRGPFMLRRDSPGGVAAYSLNGSRISFIDLQFPVIPE